MDHATLVEDLPAGSMHIEWSTLPSVSETIDWMRALVVLNVDKLEPQLARETLNFLLKYEGDVATATPKLEELISNAPGARR